MPADPRPFWIYELGEEGAYVIEACTEDEVWAFAVAKEYADPGYRSSYVIDPVTADEVDDLRDRLERATDALRDVLQMHGMGGWHSGPRKGMDTQEAVLTNIYAIVEGGNNA